MVKAKESAKIIAFLLTLLKEQGATTAMSVPVSHVIIDERVRL